MQVGVWGHSPQQALGLSAAQPPASPWTERSAGTDVRRSAEGAGEGRSPKRSEGLWACIYIHVQVYYERTHLTGARLRYYTCWVGILLADQHPTNYCQAQENDVVGSDEH